MRYRKLTKQTNVTGKRTLVRISANVSIHKRKSGAEDLLRLEKLVPTLSHLARKKAKVILISHLGRPAGRRVKGLTMAPVAKRLTHILQRKIQFVSSTVGSLAEKSVDTLRPGGILFLENVRFQEGELKNQPSFSLKLARLGDVYINEAFSVAHRKHASIASLPLHLPGYAGFQFQEEVATLEKVLINPKKPLAVIIGGAKILSKLGVISGFKSKAHVIVLAGDIANTLIDSYRFKKLSAKEQRAVRVVKKYTQLYSSILLPEDVVVKRKRSIYTIPTSQLMPKDTIIDIGSESTARILSILQSTNTIVWNGPLGITEVASGKRSSVTLARFLARQKSLTIIGGGETTQLIASLGLKKQYHFISTGGGAMLAFLSGEELPGIKSLRN